MIRMPTLVDLDVVALLDPSKHLFYQQVYQKLIQW